MKITNENIKAYPTLVDGDKWYKDRLFDKNIIKKIQIVDNYQKENLVDNLCWDISNEKDQSVRAVIINDGTQIILFGNGSGKIKAGNSMSLMFDGFESLEIIEGLDLLLTNKVEDMSYLFRHCVSLRKLDLSSWDVSNVRSFRGTFCLGHNQIGDAKLEYLNIDGWDVSSANDMAYMFYGCGKLREINVSKWNTTNVRNFRHTFADCFKLKEIDTKNWDTKSVITFDGIFNDCRSLKYIDISNWDTSSCEEFDQMFDNCTSLRVIKGLNKINTNNGISFEEMFFNCKSIRSLDLSSIDTRKVDGHEFVAYNSSIKGISNMKKILVGLNKLKELKIGCNFVYPISNIDDYHLLKIIDDVGYVIISPNSSSMRPMLHKKTDQAVFKFKDNYKKNDIVLFKSDLNSNLIMHRIKKVFPLGYLICGDNSHYDEFIFKENVYAYASEIHRDGRIINRESLEYKLLSYFSMGYNWFNHDYKRYRKMFKKSVKKNKQCL